MPFPSDSGAMHTQSPPPDGRTMARHWCQNKMVGMIRKEEKARQASYVGSGVPDGIMK